jgi:Flp pilus assembly protein TadD
LVVAADSRLKSAIEAFQSGDLDRALADAQEALDSAPSPQWHHLMGLIQCRLGDPAAGADHLRAAAEGSPGDARIQVMLARALIDAGRAAEVLAMPEPPPIRSGADLALWQARAEAADAAGNGEAAIDAWSRITAAASRDWRAWGNLGNALKAQQRLPESAAAFLAAARLNGEDLRIRDDAVAALLDAARFLEVFLHFDEAEQALREAHALDPMNLSVVQNLAAALERTNRLEEARKLVEDALAAGVDSDGLCYVRALLAWRGGRPGNRGSGPGAACLGTTCESARRDRRQRRGL